MLVSPTTTYIYDPAITDGTASSPVAGFKTGGNPMSPMSPVGQVPQAQQQSAPVSPFGSQPPFSCAIFLIILCSCMSIN